MGVGGENVQQVLNSSIGDRLKILKFATASL